MIRQYITKAYRRSDGLLTELPLPWAIRGLALNDPPERNADTRNLASKGKERDRHQSATQPGSRLPRGIASHIPQSSQGRSRVV